MKRRAAVLAGFALVFVVLASSPHASAHTFLGDESATFIAAVEKINVHLNLVTQSVGVDDVQLAATHADSAAAGLDEHMIDEISERSKRIGAELPAALADLGDMLAGPDQLVQEVGKKVSDAKGLLGEAVSVRIDREQMSSSTVKALVIAGLADEVLAEYTAAFGEEAHDHDSGGNSTEVVELSSLQGAQGLAARMGELYTELEAPDGSREAFDEIGAGIEELQATVDNEESVANVAAIVHGSVHENLGVTFGLPLKEEEDDDDGDSGAITLEGESTTGMFHVEVGWTPDDIGSENHFMVEITDAQGNHLVDVTYDIMLLKEGEELDGAHRVNQTATDQHYTFNEQGSYTLRIENISGSGESEAVEIPVQVTPEFPLGAFGIAAAALSAIVAISRSWLTHLNAGS